MSKVDQVSLVSIGGHIMFKKLGKLLFDDVEQDEEEIEEPIKIAVKQTEVKPIVKVSPVNEEAIQKSFVKPKEKSIFIDNSPRVKPAEVKVEVKPEVKEETYTFTPIISPILGAKNAEDKEYPRKKVSTRPQKPTPSHLKTIISPMYGLASDTSDDAKVDKNDNDHDEDVSFENHEVIVEVNNNESEFVNLTLDDLMGEDVNKDKKTYYFIGIKGTGMSALANLLHDAKHHVMGCDTENYVFTEVELLEKNIEIVPFGSQNITKDMVVIVGNSFGEDHEDVQFAKAQGATLYTYPKFLGEYIENYVSVAISGSHGKTTTTSMIADMLRHTVPTAHLIGDGRGQSDPGANIIAVEACEYKRHFIDYKADYSIITNLEWDHVDYFTTPEMYLQAFEDFANQTRKAVLIFGDDADAHTLNVTTPTIFYGESEDNDLYVKNIVETTSHSRFDVVYNNKEIGSFTINRTGRHMIYNALASIGIGLLIGLEYESINAGLAEYQGARRRFDVVEVNDSVIIDDYAHHPTEILVTLEAAYKKYPNQKMIAVYHPDRITRLDTFEKEFIEVLRLADQVAIGSAVDSDGFSKVINTNALLSNIDRSFVVDDKLESVEQLAYLAPAVFIFMGTKEMHTLKQGLIDYLS